jgi:hypothetical protein
MHDLASEFDRVWVSVIEKERGAAERAKEGQ